MFLRIPDSSFLKHAIVLTKNFDITSISILPVLCCYVHFVSKVYLTEDLVYICAIIVLLTFGVQN